MNDQKDEESKSEGGDAMNIQKDEENKSEEGVAMNVQNDEENKSEEGVAMNVQKDEGNKNEEGGAVNVQKDKENKSEGYGAPWYTNSRYTKFWYHYNSMMMTAHRDAIVKARYNAHKKAQMMRMLLHMKGIPVGNMKMQQGKYSSSSSLNKTPSEISRKNRNKKKRRRKKRNRRRRAMALLSSNQDSVSDTELLHTQMSKGMHINDTEDEEEDMDINEDLMIFLEHSHKHRADWKVRKGTLKTSESGMFITPVSMQENLSKEHPDVTRSREMQQLYGSASPRIHAMETAIQLSFDRISTLYRPQFWPNIPIRVMF